MSRNILTALVFFQLAIFQSTSLHALNINTGLKSVSEPAAVALIDSRLQSAFLRRGLMQDKAPTSTSAPENIARLRSHFDAVLEILEARKFQSLNTAADRLEKFRNEDWTTFERKTWVSHLAHRRMQHIHRLERYRDRGIFPQNEHDAIRAIPVFVDNYGTDCAVGHLIRESGNGQLVDAIADQNNLIFLTDVDTGPVVDWIALSGLLQEEAALIQPAYDPPPFDAFLSELGNTGSVSHGGLTYGSFSSEVFPGDLEVGPAGIAVDNEPHNGFTDFQMYTRYEDWLFFGSPGYSDNGIVSIRDIEASSVPIGVVYAYAYTVTVDSPNSRITAASTTNSPNYNFNQINIFPDNNSDGGRIDIDTIISQATDQDSGFFPQGARLGTLHIDSEDRISGGIGDLFYGNDYQEFAPQQAIRVTTFVNLENSAQFTSLSHSFQVVPVPEPMMLHLLIFASAPLVFRRRN